MDNRYLELEGERLRFVRDEKCVRHGRRERYRDAGGKEPPTRLFLARPYSIEFDVKRLDLEIYRRIHACPLPRPNKRNSINRFETYISSLAPRINFHVITLIPPLFQLFQLVVSN